MLTLCGPDPFDRLMMSFGPWGVPPNVMNCVEFGFDRWRGFGSVGGPFWPIAIHLPTRPYNFASTTVQQVIKKLTSLNLVLRTTKMTPVKPQISKFKAEKSCQVGFNVSRRLYSWAFVKRVKSFVHVNISFESNNLSVEIVQGLLGLNLKRGWSVLNVNNTVASNTNIYRDYTLTCTNDLTRLTNAHE